MDWRDKFRKELDEPQGLPLHKAILVRVSGSGARALTSHCDAQGIHRERWIREAIVEKMQREAAEEIPEMNPYRGDRLLREIRW